MVHSFHTHDMVDMLNKAAVALRNRDASYLKKISNYSIDYASTLQDEVSLSIAVLVYALSKIIDRLYEGETPAQEKILERIHNRLEKISILLEKEKMAHYQKDVKEIYGLIEDLDEKLRIYIQEVLEKARINKGSKIYERGIALGRTAELLGLTQWELVNYIGHTTMYDHEEGGKISSRERIAYAKKIFSL